MRSVLHDSGLRAYVPFIDVNCAAIPDSMFEAELFGYEAGAKWSGWQRSSIARSSTC